MHAAHHQHSVRHPQRSQRPIVVCMAGGPTSLLGGTGVLWRGLCW